LEHTGAA